MYRHIDQQKIYTSCADAMVRGGIVANPGEPLSILIKVNIFKYNIDIFANVMN